MVKQVTTFVGKLSIIAQPTRHTQPFILLGQYMILGVETTKQQTRDMYGCMVAIQSQ